MTRTTQHFDDGTLIEWRDGVVSNMTLAITGAGGDIHLRRTKTIFVRHVDRKWNTIDPLPVSVAFGGSVVSGWACFSPSTLGMIFVMRGAT